MTSISYPWTQISMGAPGGPMDIPSKVSALTPGMMPISFSHATFRSFVWTPRFSDSSRMTCTAPRLDPDLGISPRVCPTRASLDRIMESPVIVLVFSARRNRAASICLTACRVVAEGDPSENSTVAVIINPSISGMTRNLIIPLFMRPMVIKRMLMATQRDT